MHGQGFFTFREAGRVRGRAYLLKGNIPVFVSQSHYEHVLLHHNGLGLFKKSYKIYDGRDYCHLITDTSYKHTLMSKVI